MFSLLQADTTNTHRKQTKQQTRLELWLGDKHEYICSLPANDRAIIDYLEAFINRPLPRGFVPALQDSINTLAGDQPAAPVLEVLQLLEQQLGDALTEYLPTEYANDKVPYRAATFAFDVFRVKTDANLRFVAASRAHKQRLWIPQDTQGRGMVCGWLACS
jgi:hypothetical protein